MKGGKLEKMSEEDEKILNNLVNKKKQVLEFKEVQSIVKLLLGINKKINKLLPTELKVELRGRDKRFIYIYIWSFYK